MRTRWVPRGGAVGAAVACFAIVVGTSGCHMLFTGMFVWASPPVYSPGTLGAELARATHAERKTGDVDVVVSLLQDGERTVLEWRMGNGSLEPVGTDLSVLVVTARGAEGATTRVALVDPAGEIGPRPLAARRAAFERIAMRVPENADHVCVAWAGAIASGSSASPACFTRTAAVSAGWEVDGAGAT